MNYMITCDHCKRVLLSVLESTEIEVRGEVTLMIPCEGCKNVHHEYLYVYDKERIIKRGKKK
jgi:hypothetical protein